MGRDDDALWPADYARVTTGNAIYPRPTYRPKIKKETLMPPLWPPISP